MKILSSYQSAQQKAPRGPCFVQTCNRAFFLKLSSPSKKIFLDSKLYFYLLRCGAECKCLLGEFVQNILFKPSQRETPLSWGKCNISFLLTLPIITILIIIIFFFNDVITNKEYHPLYLARANITILFANSSFSIFCRRIKISSSIFSCKFLVQMFL